MDDEFPSLGYVLASRGSTGKEAVVFKTCGVITHIVGEIRYRVRKTSVLFIYQQDTAF